MSVETEIERLNASKSAIAQAIRDKGVDVPEDAKLDTFADYVAMIGAASGIPVTFTGNPVVATDTIESRPFAGLKIYGKSTQTSSQLLPLTESSYSANGLTATLQDDGSLIVNGTPGSSFTNLIYIPLSLSPGDYYIAGGENTSGHVVAFIEIKKSTGTDYFANQSFSVDGTETSIIFTLQSNFANAINNYRVPAMLNKGTEPLPVQKYNGTPSPENPIPIVSAGNSGSIELVINGKNLFPIGTYDASGKQYALIGADSSSKAQEYFCAKSGQQVSISFDAANPSECKLFFACLGYGETYFNKQFRPNITGNKISSTITLDRDVDKIGFSIHPVQSVFLADFMFSNIQAELNSEATAYEQYAAQPLIPSTPSGLPGVPVSSGGNCIDSTGQAFTSDYWDFADGLQHILCGQIASYNGEEITTPYISSTGSLTTGAQVVYVLPEPQTQPIPAETLAAYKALTTYANTTVISTAEPVAGMEARVYCDTEKTIDRKVSEGIAAAVKLSGGNL